MLHSKILGEAKCYIINGSHIKQYHKGVKFYIKNPREGEGGGGGIVYFSQKIKMKVYIKCSQ